MDTPNLSPSAFNISIIDQFPIHAGQRATKDSIVVPFDLTLDRAAELVIDLQTGEHALIGVPKLDQLYKTLAYMLALSEQPLDGIHLEFMRLALKFSRGDLAQMFDKYLVTDIAKWEMGAAVVYTEYECHFRNFVRATVVRDLPWLAPVGAPASGLEKYREDCALSFPQRPPFDPNRKLIARASLFTDPDLAPLSVWVAAYRWDSPDAN